MSAMGFLSDIGNFLTGGLVDSVGNAIDRNVTSDEERLTLKNEAQKLINEAAAKVMEHEAAFQHELTERWKADMASSNPLAKKIRPWLALGSFGNLLFQYLLDTGLKNAGPYFNLPLQGVDPTVLEGSWWAFATFAGMYAVVRGGEKTAAIFKGR